MDAMRLSGGHIVQAGGVAYAKSPRGSLFGMAGVEQVKGGGGR